MELAKSELKKKEMAEKHISRLDKNIHMLRRGSYKHPNVLPDLDTKKAVKNFSVV